MAITGKSSFLGKLKATVVGNIEIFFYWYGLTIAKNPWRFICTCLLLVAVCSLGFLRFRQEKNPLKLWIPPDSDFKRDTDWIMETFKEGFRSQYLLIKAENVLEPSVLFEAEKVRKKVISMSVNNMTFEDVCFRIPAVKPGSISIFDYLGGRRKRSFFFFGRDENAQIGGLEFDPSLYLGTSSYCRIVNKLPKVCLEMNLQQMWSNSDVDLQKLTLDDVVEKLNTTSISPVTGHSIAFPELLGGIVRDSQGRIVGASSLLSIWMTHVNFSAVDMDEAGNLAGTSDWATMPVLDWEAGYVDLLQAEAESQADKNLSLFFEAGRSYGDISGKSMFQDIGKLFIGSLLMFLFIQLVLPSKYNMVEMRFWLGCVGLICVVLSFVVAVALCSLVGIPYGPVHTSLPFLMLGIGVDDMFVITACWHNLLPSERKLRLDQQIALTLKNAGLSITITSVTDCIAFLVGSFTILPCLQSFCLYTAAGIIVMYIFQSTVFVAFLSLDAGRTQNGNNCALWCIKHENFRPSHPDSESFQTKIFGAIYEKFILTKPVKVLVIVFTVGLAAVGVVGNIQLKQRFEPSWFLPNNSYLFQYITQRTIFYPDLGMDGRLFVGKANYSQEFTKIHNLAVAFTEQDRVLKLVDSWTHGFIRYSESAEKVDILADNITESDFHRLLSSYLWSPSGARFQKNFRFAGELVCGEPAPPIEISSVDFIFRIFSGPEEHLPAMRKLKLLVSEAKLPHAAVWAKIFANWVTDEVIDRELYRNLGMAMGCVMICTAILIVDLQICFWIFLCVFLTLVDVAGFMFFWGLYIDIASCIALVLAVGLCVDFAAHIGHTFLRLTGTRQQRALKTVKYIGTATVNGALSTLLALSLLGFSDAYIFTTFFKIFLLVILFGIFHGVVFMPVVLSIMGPPSYNVALADTPIPKEMKILRVEGNSDEVEQLNAN